MGIRFLKPPSLQQFLDHLARVVAQSGRGDTPVFTATRPEQIHERKALTAERWNKPLEEPGWERAWALFDGEAMVGHLNLVAGGTPALAHRATLGMAIESGYRGQGAGRALLEVAINWAQTVSSLAWLDLAVFAHNELAHKLYVKNGFQELGRIEDALRVNGKPLTDIRMAFSTQTRCRR